MIILYMIVTKRKKRQGEQNSNSVVTNSSHDFIHEQHTSPLGHLNEVYYSSIVDPTPCLPARPLHLRSTEDIAYASIDDVTYDEATAATTARAETTSSLSHFVAPGGDEYTAINGERKDIGSTDYESIQENEVGPPMSPTDTYYEVMLDQPSPSQISAVYTQVNKERRNDVEMGSDALQDCDDYAHVESEPENTEPRTSQTLNPIDLGSSSETEL